MMLAMRAALLGAILLVVVPAAGASTIAAFRTPSGNIGCVYGSGLGGAPSLGCEIRTGLRPRPPRPQGCDVDWGDSFGMTNAGRVFVVCHGDTSILPRARVLRYGSTWTRGGFVCKSRITGLRCRNIAGHGFFMSKQHSYRF
jgi:hypothetical protein